MRNREAKKRSPKVDINEKTNNSWARLGIERQALEPEDRMQARARSVRRYTTELQLTRYHVRVVIVDACHIKCLRCVIWALNLQRWRDSMMVVSKFQAVGI